MNEQMGWKALKRNLEKEMPDWANILPSLPRKVNEVLENQNKAQTSLSLQKQLHHQKIFLGIIAFLLLVLVWK